MDYGASISDADNPATASPWGTSPDSSPRHNRTTFGALGGEPVPPYGFAPHGQGNGLASDLEEGGFGAGDSGHHRPDTASSLGAAEGPSGLVGSSQNSHQEPHQHQPHGQARRAEEHGAAQAQEQAHRPVQPLFRLQAKITALERADRKDPLLRFDVYTNVPNFRTTQYRDVRRLHSEFVKLGEHLISANPDAIVPAVPPSLTSAGAGTDEDEARVKALLQRWLNYVCSNGVLMRDNEMVLFVESDFGYSPMVKRKQPATGVRRKILKQFAPPPDDTPELQQARPTVKLFYLGTLDAAHKVDKFVKARRVMALAESDFGVKLSSMHVQEPHPGLSKAYQKLGKIVQTVGDSRAAQATAESTTLSDPLQYHSQDAFIVKETLTNRQILIREFLQAQENTRSKLNAADRLKASSNIRREKVEEAIASLEEAQQNERYLLQKTTRVTQNLVHERRKWFARTAADLRLSIREFVLREIEAERRTLALLESVRPDVRSIDASGGLSRLGREAHPAARRASLVASQGPRGDSWSGVPRRTDALSRSVSGSFVAGLPEEAVEAETEGAGAGARALTGVNEEEDEDRVDARNAASRLATSTF